MNGFSVPTVPVVERREGVVALLAGRVPDVQANGGLAYSIGVGQSQSP